MDTANLQKQVDELWGKAVDYYNAHDYTNSLQTAQTMENMKTFSTSGVYELIAANAFMLGNFELAINACEAAFARDRHSKNASMQFVNVWTRVEKAANFMLEKNENLYEVPFPKRSLTIQEVLDLLYQIKETDAALYGIGLPKIEDLRYKLSMQAGIAFKP
jgi:hypothetical protein